MSGGKEDWEWDRTFGEGYHKAEDLRVRAGEVEKKSENVAGEGKRGEGSNNIWRQVVGCGWILERDNEEGMVVTRRRSEDGEEWGRRREGEMGRSGDFAKVTEQPLERLRIICETPSQYPATLLKNTLDNLESGGFMMLML